ncbi:hypothetical protein [Thermococcus piezophilus]|uniref:Uncharacterized protein n=1 Tax=Thermococcus piezophilus TaxID=1712654 RepID=A0A172WJ42_9EURY|nr:hypothetical protein [Thermococcus piezophilus]ANF23492.1 hypothetical protein A7C91_10235 [Thermococcus piezophilus]
MTTYGPVEGNGPVFEVMKNASGTGYILLFNNTPVRVCDEYYIVEITRIEDGWASVGHYLNWTSYVPEYLRVDVNSDPQGSTVLVFGGILNVPRTPLTRSCLSSMKASKDTDSILLKGGWSLR